MDGVDAVIRDIDEVVADLTGVGQSVAAFDRHGDTDELRAAARAAEGFATRAALIEDALAALLAEREDDEAARAAEEGAAA